MNSISIDGKLKMYEVGKNSMDDHHIKILRVKGISGSMIGFMGLERMRELIEILKSKLPYKKGHVLLFGGGGEITKQPFIQNCIFSEGNENIDHTKLLKSVGYEIIVKSKDEGLEITQCSIVGSRTYSLKLEGFDNHTNVYIGEYNSDVPKQHFRRLRTHKTTKSNPDYMFITHHISEKLLNKYKRKLAILKKVNSSKN